MRGRERGGGIGGWLWGAGREKGTWRVGEGGSGREAEEGKGANRKYGVQKHVTHHSDSCERYGGRGRGVGKRCVKLLLNTRLGA